MKLVPALALLVLAASPALAEEPTPGSVLVFPARHGDAPRITLISVTNTSLSKSVRAQLAETATIEFARVDSQHDSVDGTVKWLFVMPAITLALIATNEWHHAVFTSNEPFVLEDFTTIARGYGFWFWTNMAYSYLMVMAGFIIFLRKVIQTRGHVRIQAMIMMAGSALPLLSKR